jgi:hypothetical protein
LGHGVEAQEGQGEGEQNSAVHGKQDGRFMSNGKDSRDVSSKKSGLVRCFFKQFSIGA